MAKYRAFLVILLLLVLGGMSVGIPSAVADDASTNCYYDGYNWYYYWDYYNYYWNYYWDNFWYNYWYNYWYGW